VAPALFSDVWEFNVTIFVGWVVFGLAGMANRTSPLHVGDRWQFALATVILSVLAIHFLILWGNLGQTAWVVRFDWMVPLVVGAALATLICVVLWRTRLASDRTWPRALVLCVTLLAGKFMVDRVQGSRTGTVFGARDFYGVVRVEVVQLVPSGTRVQQLLDGNTIHGVQVLDGVKRNLPTAYYSPSTGISIASRHLIRGAGPGHDSSGGNAHFGILGMGAGTLAAFAQPGDRVRFYEINPTVIEISKGPKALFTFIRDGAGEVVVVTGDARLSLERELIESDAQGFDLLAIDAFSSDAVPVHLLTEEAFRVYAAHLRGDDAILAVNITNRHLDLEPVIAACARKLGFQGIRIDSKGDPPLPEESSWILLARNARVFEHPLVAAARPKPLGIREVAFTDRYSNLFRVLK